MICEITDQLKLRINKLKNYNFQFENAGPLTSIEMQIKGFPLSIWTLPEDISYAKFAAEFAPKIFSRIQEKFQVKMRLFCQNFVFKEISYLFLG